MSKINDILSNLTKSLPADQVKEFTESIEAILADVKTDLEKEYETKLQEAYEQLSAELKVSEKIGETGYSEAFGIITDLRNRLETQRTEFDAALDEGYEEAFQMLQAEQTKNEKLESELYEQYDNKLGEMREYMIDKIDEFLQHKGKEIYEQARRDVVNDPQWAEHRVTLNKVVETVADYISDEDFALATSTKLETSSKENSDLKSQLKIVEARNIRLSTQMQKLEETVRQNADVIKEHTSVTNKNERVETAKKVEGRGKKVTENVEVIKEAADKSAAENKDAVVSTPISEGTDWSQMRALAGISETK
jgi:hypothetical protein